MVKEKPGFYIWWKTVDAMAELSFEEKGMVYTAAEEYARNGVIPSFDDRLLRSIWVGLKADLDADDAKYKKNQKDNQMKGWKSDFKRNYAPAHGIDPNDEAELEAYIQQRLTEVDNGEPMSSNTNTTSISNITSSINSNGNASNREGKPTPTKHKHGEYSNVLLTDEELSKLKEEFPRDWESRIDRLSEYIASTGKAYKSHLVTIRAWAKKDKLEQGKGFSRAGGDWCEGITPEDHANDIELPY